MQPFFLHPAAKTAIFNGTIDLDTDAMYAALMRSTLTPTLAMVDYGDMAQVTTGAITGATAANPVVITDVAHGLTSGDHVSITGVAGMTQLNGNTYQITVLTADTFSLQNNAGTNIDGTGFTAYTSGGTWYETYECGAQADYGRIALAGQAIITDGNNRALDCNDITWGATVSLEAKLYAIFVGTAATPTAADVLVGWAVMNPASVKDITAITAANPAVATSAAHGFSNADPIMVQGVDMLDVLGQVNGIHNAANVAANTFDLGTLNLSAAALAGRTGTATELNSTLTQQSVNSAFTIQIPATGLFSF